MFGSSGEEKKPLGTEKPGDSPSATSRTPNMTGRNPFQLGLTNVSFQFRSQAGTSQRDTSRFGVPRFSFQPTTTQATTTAPSNFSFSRGFQFEPGKTGNTPNFFSLTSTDPPVKFEQVETVKGSSTQIDAGSRVMDAPGNVEKVGAHEGPEAKATVVVSNTRSLRTGAGLFGRAVAEVKSSVGPAAEKSTVKKGADADATADKETFLSPAEINKFNGISCKGVPEFLNNKQFLAEHFGKYGTIARIHCNTGKSTATVIFDNDASAAAAKQNGKILGPDLAPINIFFRISQRTSSRSSSKKASPSSSRMKEQSELQEELQAMEGVKSLDYSPYTEKPVGDEVSPVTRSRSSKARSENVSKHKKEHTAADLQKYSRLENTESPANILKTPALATEEKFNILQIRDKLIRQKVKRHSDITTATATIGICPDMCPEKERYLREDKRQLHFYELKPLADKDKAGHSYDVDPRLLVKEYSRSSADQEEPLGHELRPTEVLDMTMNYLLCNIVQRLDESDAESASEWFDFLWNRTRAIRKDITQQHLCNQTCVSLVEKCARFHIYCSVRLCEEDIGNFDSKINNENLTKCLQTLKHFYADLAVVGENCPNESEFQAYNVLLNLNEGDILRHVQHLSPDVRHSPQIAFALQVFSALNSNNYVRFFKLVQKADYMSACVLHRYFLQIRVKTLLTIMKAYCSPNQHTQFTLDKLVSLLAFDDQSEATYFFNSYGFSVDNSLVVLDRSKFCEPDIWIPRRPKLMIESKKTSSLAVVLNGGVPLAQNPIWTYEPHVSFEANGLLKTSAIDAQDQLETLRLLSNGATGSRNQLERHKTQIEEPRPVVGVNDETVLENGIAEMAEQLVLEVTGEMSRQQSELTVTFYQALWSFALPLMFGIIGEVLLSNMAVICQTVIDELISERDETKKREMEEKRLMEKLCAQVAVECLKDVMDAVVITGAEQVVCDIVGDALTANLIHSTAQEVLTHLCVEIHSEETLLREKINLIKEKRNTRRMRSTFAKWRMYIEKRRNRRRSMENFPTSFVEKYPDVKFKSSNRIALVSPPTLAAKRKSMSKALDAGVLIAKLSKKLDSMSVDLNLIADSQIPKIWPKNWDLFWLSGFPCWKLCVSLSDAGCEVSNWMRQKLVVDGERQGAVTVNVGFISENQDEMSTSQLLFGSQGIIYLRDSKFSSKEDQLKLSSLFKMKPPVPTIPLLVVTNSGNNERLFSEELPDWLTDQSLVEDWKEIIINIDEDHIDSAQALHSGLCWLADKCPAPVRLIRKNLDHYVEDAVNHLFMGRMAHNVHIEANTWILMFNNVVDHIAAVAADVNLTTYSWPPLKDPDDWNDEEYLVELYRAIIALKLPRFPDAMESEPSWEKNCKFVMDYIQELDDPVPYLLAYRIESNISDIEKQFLEDAICDHQMPWLHILSSCAEYRINRLKYDQMQNKPMTVVYDQEMLDGFIDVGIQGGKNVKRQEFSSVNLKRKSENLELCDVVSPKKMKSSETLNISRKYHAVNEMSTRLKSDVEMEKAAMARFEKFLEGLVEGSWPEEEFRKKSSLRSPVDEATRRPDIDKMSLAEQIDYFKVQVANCKKSDARLETLLQRYN